MSRSASRHVWRSWLAAASHRRRNQCGAAAYNVIKHHRGGIASSFGIGGGLIGAK